LKSEEVNEVRRSQCEVTEEVMENWTPEYIINLVDRNNLDTDTVDITNFLTKEGHIRYLDAISSAFARISLIPDRFEKDHLYLIAQDDYEAIKVGLTKTPKDRLTALQTGNPRKLHFLYYYDPIERDLDMEPFESNRTPNRHESHALSWFCGNMGNKMMGEWFHPDERAFRMMIREGIHILRWYHGRQNPI